MNYEGRISDPDVHHSSFIVHRFEDRLLRTGSLQPGGTRLALVAGAALAVVFAACGGGTSSAPTANNPVPTLSSIDPSSAVAGSGSFTLTVNGSNFISGSVVRWNGANRTTTFVSATQLTAFISSADISSPGTADVTVFTPAPGGGTSSAVTFTITAPASTISALTPSSGVAGARAFTLILTGSGFVSTSVVRWNGSERTTTFVSGNELRADIPADDVAVVGAAQVEVFTPDAPNGGLSNSVNFPIVAPEPLAVATSRLPDSAPGKRYHFVLAAVGGVPDLDEPELSYFWEVTGGALPGGLSLDARGLLSGVVGGGAGGFSFDVSVTDSATTPSSTERTLDLTIQAALTRNDDCTGGPTTVTQISNGRLRATFSPYGDVDVYSFEGTAGQTVTIETFAQRLDENFDGVRDSFADTMLELLDNTCPAPQLNGASALAFNDDLSSFPDPHVQDSRVTLTLPYPGTYYIRVREFRGDGRPDLVYDLSLSGAD